MNTQSRFEVETQYGDKAYAVLVHVMMKHVRRWPRYAVMLTGLTSVVYAGYVMLSSGTISPIALLFLFLGNAFMVLGVLAPRLAVRMMSASNKKGETPGFRYAFYEDRMEIATGQGVLSYTYPFVLRVLDSQGFFILFLRDGQVFLLEHARMEQGASASLHTFLNGKLQERQGKTNALR